MATTPTNRICVVTGAARGIGAATARLAGQRGYAVVVNYLKAAAEAEAVVAEILRDGGRAIALRADVASEKDVAALFAAVDREFGSVTDLVNNAGIASARRSVAEFGADELRRVIEVNLLGTFFCTQEAVKRMAQSTGGSGGSIVNLSSIAARTGGYHLSPYAATKAAIEAMTTSLARELAAEAIRVNAVSPGIIATNQQPLGDAAWKSSAAARVPLGRLGTADEVAQAILWLLSEEATYVSGANLAVSGGI